MIQVDALNCTGCGACIEVCPTGAIRIAGGHAEIDETLCCDCQACIPACTRGALASVAIAPSQTRLPQVKPQAVIDAAPARPVLRPWRQQIVPALAGAITFVGQEILPRILQVLASPKEERRPTQGEPAPIAGQGAPSGPGSRQRHRGRHGRMTGG